MPELKGNTGSLRMGLLASTGKHLDSFFVDIIDQWRARGIKVYPAAGSVARNMDVDIIHGLTQSPSLRNLRCLDTLGRWVRVRDLDLVVTNTATASTLIRSKSFGVPVVYFCHGLHWNKGSRGMEILWQMFERALLKRTAGVITMNSADREWFNLHAPRVAKAHTESGVGVPTQYLAKPSRTRRTSGPLSLLWIGDFSARKRPLLAVEVAHRLRQNGIPFTLTMLGDGPLQHAVRQRVTSLDLHHSIVLPGRVAKSLDSIDSTDLLVHTATWEGLPRVLLEARARGKACVGFDVKGVRDIPGIQLVEEGDIPGMVRAILNVQKHPEVASTGITHPLVRSSREVADYLAPFLVTVAGSGSLQTTGHTSSHTDEKNG